MVVRDASSVCLPAVAEWWLRCLLLLVSLEVIVAAVVVGMPAAAGVVEARAAGNKSSLVASLLVQVLLYR